MNGLAELEIHPGGDRPLGLAGLGDLADRLKRWRRAVPDAVLLTVTGDAWQWDAGAGPATESVARQINALVIGLFALDTPVITTVSGTVSGPGLALFLAADVRLAGPQAIFSAGPPEVAVVGGTDRLLGSRASAGAVALAFTNGSWTAERAAAAGIVAEVGEPALAREIAHRLAASPEQSAALARAARSEQRSELSAALAYRSWLAGPDVATD